MKIEKIIYDIIEEDNPRRSIAFFETLVLKLISRYLADQDKKFIFHHRKANRSIIKYDGFAPFGFDDFEGETVFEIKLYRSKSSLYNVFLPEKFWERFLDDSIKNVIFVVSVKLSEEDKSILLSKINSPMVNIHIWDIAK